MSTTTHATSPQSPDVVAASRPWALYALGQHVADHELSFVHQSCGDEMIVDVEARAAREWRTTNVTELDHTAVRTIAIDGAWTHTVHLVLHGSCVQVTLRWLTYLDHHTCEACRVGLCACRDIDGTCQGRVEHACRHGQNLCPDHAPEQCDECRQGRVA